MAEDDGTASVIKSGPTNGCEALDDETKRRQTGKQELKDKKAGASVANKSMGSQGIFRRNKKNNKKKSPDDATTQSKGSKKSRKSAKNLFSRKKDLRRLIRFAVKHTESTGLLEKAGGKSVLKELDVSTIIREALKYHHDLKLSEESFASYKELPTTFLQSIVCVLVAHLTHRSRRLEKLTEETSSQADQEEEGTCNRSAAVNRDDKYEASCSELLAVFDALFHPGRQNDEDGSSKRIANIHYCIACGQDPSDFNLSPAELKKSLARIAEEQLGCGQNVPKKARAKKEPVDNLDATALDRWDDDVKYALSLLDLSMETLQLSSDDDDDYHDFDDYLSESSPDYIVEDSYFDDDGCLGYLWGRGAPLERAMPSLATKSFGSESEVKSWDERSTALSKSSTFDADHILFTQNDVSLISEASVEVQPISLFSSHSLEILPTSNAFDGKDNSLLDETPPLRSSEPPNPDLEFLPAADASFAREDGQQVKEGDSLDKDTSLESTDFTKKALKDFGLTSEDNADKASSKTSPNGTNSPKSKLDDSNELNGSTKNESGCDSIAGKLDSSNDGNNVSDPWSNSSWNPSWGEAQKKSNGAVNENIRTKQGLPFNTEPLSIFGDEFLPTTSTDGSIERAPVGTDGDRCDRKNDSNTLTTGTKTSENWDPLNLQGLRRYNRHSSGRLRTPDFQRSSLRPTTPESELRPVSGESTPRTSGTKEKREHPSPDSVRNFAKLV